MVAGVAAFCVVDGRTGRALYEADFGSTQRVSVRLLFFSSLSLYIYLVGSRAVSKFTFSLSFSLYSETGRRATLASIRHRLRHGSAEREEVGTHERVFKNNRPVRFRFVRVRVLHAREFSVCASHDETRGREREGVLREHARSRGENANEPVLLRRRRRRWR
jgi:hypothetical protein